MNTKSTATYLPLATVSPTYHDSCDNCVGVALAEATAKAGRAAGIFRDPSASLPDEAIATKPVRDYLPGNSVNYSEAVSLCEPCATRLSGRKRDHSTYLSYADKCMSYELLVRQGWTMEAALNHIEGSCDVYVCTAHSD